jgi:hypothetical protein
LSRWYRAYADAHRNPKVAALTDREFRLWHRLLSIAAENDGAIPPIDALKRLLNARLDYLTSGVKALLKAGLIDLSDEGFTPHNWSKRQYKSDSSAERVQRHREQKRTDVTAPETDTETETENPPKPPKGGEPNLFGEGAPPVEIEPAGEKYSDAFEAFWAQYPNKTGKGKAAKAFDAAVKRLGGSKRLAAKKLVDSAAAQKRVWRRKGVEGRYIPHPTTWLNQSRWDDAEVVAELARPAAVKPEAPEISPAEPKPARREKVTGSVGWDPDRD